MEGGHSHNCGLHGASISSAYSQTFDELSFERGIWQAALDNDVDKVKGLISKGHSAKELDPSGYSALHYASRAGHLETMKVLLDNNADPNVKTRGGKDTPLHRSAYKGNVEATKLLLSKNADPKLKNIDGQTPMHKAAEQGHANIVKLLLNHSPCLKTIEDSKGRLPKDFVDVKLEDLRQLLSC